MRSTDEAKAGIEKRGLSGLKICLWATGSRFY
jgi:hypothetical protein